jgi:hypothetical protein
MKDAAVHSHSPSKQARDRDRMSSFRARLKPRRRHAFLAVYAALLHSGLVSPLGERVICVLDASVCGNSVAKSRNDDAGASVPEPLSDCVFRPSDTNVGPS